MQIIILADHQNALNNLSYRFSQQLNATNQKYTSLYNEYKSAMEMVKQKQNEIKTVQKHCVKLESITKKYRKIIPERIYHNIRRTPGIKQQNTVLKCIETLLFGHREYSYSYYNVISLCNEILERFDTHEFDIQQSLFCVKALSRFLKNGGTGQGKCRLEVQQMQIATAAMMHINDEGVLLNRQLVKNAIPHENIKNIKPFMDGCINRRLKFDARDINGKVLYLTNGDRKQYKASVFNQTNAFTKDGRINIKI